MNEETLKILYERLLAGECSPAELRALLDHFEATGTDSPLMDQILDQLQSQEDVSEPMQQQVQRMLANTDRALKPIWRPKRSRIVRWLPYAAAALLAVAIGTWLVIDRQQPTNLVTVEEILPGGNRATLTLADGRVVNLDEAQTGIVIGADQITYTDGSALDVVPVEALTLTTPKGGTYQVTLPDGSKVWLNAGSMLRYPSRFTGKARVVEIVGEGYFEIEKQTKHPFIVRSEDQEITVLGTAFNITAYPDEEAMLTTLVEGAVQILNRKSNTVNQLRPGEQAVTRGATTETQAVNVANYTAWKDGKIVLEGRTLPEILKEVSRWYDIEVVYEGEVPQGTFFGRANRSSNLGTVLELLESAHVGYRLDGRTLFITSKEEVINLNQ